MLVDGKPLDIVSKCRTVIVRRLSFFGIGAKYWGRYRLIGVSSDCRSPRCRVIAVNAFRMLFDADLMLIGLANAPPRAYC